MGKKLKTPAMDTLMAGIVTINTIEEAYDFFEDLCTVGELEAMKQRFEVAALLRKDTTYQVIEEVTGASSATISRVNRALNYGNDGYDMIIKNLEALESK